ncbi:MAG: hypothetical protein GW789_06640 [Ignavibacteria bacterium]|nr:hypothetical protein [Ignavibacteria bacterium]
MNSPEAKCMHACKNTCAMLNEALRKEAAMVRFYEGVNDDCNLPEVRGFISDLIEEKRKVILRIIQKLNELHANSTSIDGIISSFDDTTGW